MRFERRAYLLQGLLHVARALFCRNVLTPTLFETTWSVRLADDLGTPWAWERTRWGCLVGLVALSDREWMMGDAGSDSGRNMSERLAEVQEMSKGMTLRQLRSLIDDDVVRRHDILMDLEIGLGELGPEDYRAELDRRVPARQTIWVIRLTWAIAVLTLAIVILEYLPRISGAGH